MPPTSATTNLWVPTRVLRDRRSPVKNAYIPKIPGAPKGGMGAELSKPGDGCVLHTLLSFERRLPIGGKRDAPFVC